MSDDGFLRLKPAAHLEFSKCQNSVVIDGYFSFPCTKYKIVSMHSVHDYEGVDVELSSVFNIGTRWY